MSYVDEVIEQVIKQNPAEPEFHQAVKEVLESLRPVIDANEENYTERMRFLRESQSRIVRSCSVYRG